jgi:CheY-like chemotaxis protein
MVTPTPASKIAIVNGPLELLGVFESMLGDRRFDVVLFEPGAHAYSQIKRLHPGLVVLGLRMEDAEGFRLLSMLKLDPDTSSIPVLTCMTELERPDSDDASPDQFESGMLNAQPSALMN